MKKEMIQWGVHVEFAILFVTLLGGFLLIDSKCERAHDRIDKLYEMFYEVVKEKK
jgi:hypothetical protein